MTQRYLGTLVVTVRLRYTKAVQIILTRKNLKIDDFNVIPSKTN